jgi:hypothetical protein
MIVLYDVIDIRSDRHYTIAVVSPKNLKYFISVNNEGEQNVEY